MPEQKLMHTNFKYRSNYGFILIAIIVMVILIFRVGFYLFNSWDLLLLLNSIAGFCVVLLIILEVYSDKKILKFKYLEKPSKRANQIQSVYKLYLFLWVIIFSLMPVNLFLRITDEKENSIFAKYRSVLLLNKIEDWENTNRLEFADKFNAGNPIHYKTFVRSMEKDSINYATIESNFANIKRNKIDFVKDRTDNLFDSFYANIRPDFNDRSSISSNFILNFAPDSSWFFTQNGNQFITTRYPKYNQDVDAKQVIMEKSNFFYKKRTVYFNDHYCIRDHPVEIIEFYY